MNTLRYQVWFSVFAPAMTSRNVTVTWKDAVFKQYDDDDKADVPSI